MRVRTGLSQTVALAGLAAEYDLREAARFALYNWAQFQTLSHREQVLIAAHYRLHGLVEAHTQVEVEAAAQRASKR